MSWYFHCHFTDIISIFYWIVQNLAKLLAFLAKVDLDLLMVLDRNVALHNTSFPIVVAFLSQPEIVFHPHFICSFWCEFKLVIFHHIEKTWTKDMQPEKSVKTNGWKEHFEYSKIWMKEINEESWRFLFKIRICCHLIARNQKLQTEVSHIVTFYWHLDLTWTVSTIRTSELPF